MENIALDIHDKRVKLYELANALALATIFYNIIEGIVSVVFGLDDGTFALFGFGLDSFVEVISGIGIWHMIKRIRQNNNTSIDHFEQQALKVTGTAFYILSAGLAIIAVTTFYQGHKPETTIWGIIISAISILTMWLLIHYKVKAGTKLNSQAILADANCTKTCMYLSLILFLSSAGFELTGVGGIDSAGAILIAGFSFREGKEAFEKAKKGTMACGCNNNCH